MLDQRLCIKGTVAELDVIAPICNSHSWCKDKHNFVNFQTFKAKIAYFAVVLLSIPKLFVLLQMHCGRKDALLFLQDQDLKKKL